MRILGLFIIYILFAFIAELAIYKYFTQNLIWILWQWDAKI